MVMPTATLTSTPVRQKRKLRPSLSPLKSAKTPLPTRSKSFSAPRPAVEAEPIQLSSSDSSVLNFKEFTFLTDEGVVRQSNVSKEHLDAFHKYLAEHYDAVCVDISAPYVFIHCDRDLSREKSLPFLVAGMIAFWKELDDGESSFVNPHTGNIAWGDPIRIDQAMADMIRPRKMLPEEVVLYLANNFFQDCEAITQVAEELVIELPRMEPQAFRERLQSLPSAICGVRCHLTFYNGPLPNTQRRARESKPNPTTLENLVADETDYVKQDGCFYPGSMLASLSADGDIYATVTAGVLVEKDGERRLTCSWHNRENHDRAHPGVFGQNTDMARKVYRVSQGATDGQVGTVVGTVQERMEPTDIALAKLDDGIEFVNEFMDIRGAPKTFLPSGAVEWGDQFMIDSFVTGPQLLLGVGVRRPLSRRRRAVAHPELFAPARQHHTLPPDEVTYVRCAQGVFSTNTKVIATEPQIRDRACGSVLVRCAEYGGKDILERGEVVAMMHYADLQPKHQENTVAQFLIYADSFDPLIEQGWTTAQQP